MNYGLDDYRNMLAGSADECAMPPQCFRAVYATFHIIATHFSRNYFPLPLPPPARFYFSSFSRISHFSAYIEIR